MSDRRLGAEVVRGVGLTKRFGAHVALDRVDLSIHAGEAVVLFGPNGAGKTTLIRLLTLALGRDGGELSFGDLDPRRDDRAIRGRIGVLGHHSFLYDDLSPRQNLEFYAALYGVADPRRRAGELLELVGLTRRADDPLRELSRGLEQQVSAARALLHDPPLLFFDEPFSGLDPEARARLSALLARLHAEGRTLLFATHDLSLGLKLAERWLLLASGRIVDFGPTAGADLGRIESEIAP